MTADTLDEQLVKYLADAHSIEEQALQQLRGAPDAARDPELAEILRRHLVETEGHERAVSERLEAYGARSSTFKDLLMRVGGAGFLLFARAQPDTRSRASERRHSCCSRPRREILAMPVAAARRPRHIHRGNGSRDRRAGGRSSAAARGPAAQRGRLRRREPHRERRRGRRTSPRLTLRRTRRARAPDGDP